MTQTGRTHVLLIEASPDETAIIEYLLADSRRLSETLSLRCAPRLSTGCHLLCQEVFDAVLLDLTCPPESGIEAFQKIHSQNPEVPIVILTNIQDEKQAAQAVAMGAQDYLIKGTFDARHLERVLGYAISQKKSRSRIETLLAEDPDGKLILDWQGTVRYANAAAQSLFGWKTKDFIGKPLTQPLPLHGADNIRLVLPRLGERMVHTRISDIEWEGKAARLVSVRDITETQRVDELKKQLNDSLRSAEVRTQIVDSISHDLRNPLTVMKTAIYALEKGLAGPTTPEQMKFIDMAARNLERQIRMVDNILDFNRLQSGNVEMEMRRLELPPLIARIAKQFAEAYSSLRLEIDVPEDLPAIEADPDLVSQVFKNLLDNAFRFANKRVAIKASAAELGNIVFSVIDDGHGISKEHLTQLFSKNAAAQPVGKIYKGSGLGLFISKEIIERHGGRIWAESIYGKGCRFNFSLPRFERSSLRNMAAAGTGGSHVIVHS